MLILAGCPSAKIAENDQHTSCEEEIVVSDVSDFEQLLVKYSGTIRAGALETANRMNDLLNEWDPAGEPAYRLKALAGMPSRELPEEIMYYFDDGIGAVAWRFEIRDGVVTAWELIPGR